MQDSDVADSVIRTWRISFDQISRQDLLAAEILSLMAVLDGQGIPEMRLNKVIKSQADFEEAIEALQAFSFIPERSEDAPFIIHVLCRSQLGND